jgi:hypothetical protein
MPGVDFRVIRSMVSILQVLELLRFVPTSARGNQVYGTCPIHGCLSRRRRCFSANLANNGYRCFQCDSKGNQLDLWAAATNQNLFDAAIDLCEKLHVAVPWIHRW